ncbi:hypothetical protein [Streptomyces griseosporeus]|uniref:hypothetical protein n=1 Tax=Streptomyces griseosporeus TaxID=1910 RepID=UPI0036FF1251
MRVWIAIWTGSTALTQAIANWLRRGVALRLLVVFLAAGFIKGLPWTTRILVTLAAAWLITAIVLGLRLPDPTAPPTPDQPPAADASATAGQPEAAAPDGQEEAATTAAPLTRDQLVRALHEVGAPHAHITALAEHLGTPNEAVRQALTAASIPIAGGVRMKSRPVAVSPGVKQTDFPPLPSPGDDPTQEGALTSNNNDNNNGRGFDTVPDEKHPARTLVRWFQTAGK